MNSRIDPRHRDTIPMHHEAQIYLLRLCADLKMLHDAGQPLRADVSRLEEWSTHRADLDDCEEPIMFYGSTHVHKEGTMFKHADLFLIANNIIGELKLRNIGEGFRTISILDVDELRRLAMRLDDCRKRVRFY